MGINIKDYKSFSNSLGFDSKQWNAVENWQILSPTRRDSLGTDELNRLIQAQFKGGLLSNCRNPWKKNFSKPFGDSEIIWSDKIIQVLNEKRQGWPRNNSLDYIANGEIGLVEETKRTIYRSFSQPKQKPLIVTIEDKLMVFLNLPTH